MQNSEYISNFLKFIRESKTNYQIASEQEIHANNETQDILHRMELKSDSYHDIYHDMVKMAKRLKQVRQKRREAKNIKEVTEPILKWANEYEKVIRTLEIILGDVRKMEERIKNKCYIEKTDVLKEVFEEEFKP